MSERRFWQAISERSAIMWVKYSDPEVGADIDGPFGFIVWGDVDSSVLQVGLSTLGPGRAGYPEWEQESPPTADEIGTRWRAFAGARARAQGVPLKFGRTKAEMARSLDHRRPEESADDFYERVALFYMGAMRSTGKPTRDIAAAAQVPKSTAARWVREARARGFLRPTKRGKTRS